MKKRHIQTEKFIDRLIEIRMPRQPGTETETERERVRREREREREREK